MYRCFTIGYNMVGGFTIKLNITVAYLQVSFGSGNKTVFEFIMQMLARLKRG